MTEHAVVQLFQNPASGSHSRRRLERLAAALRAAGADVIESADSKAPSPSIDPRATHLCVSGGDGTVRLVAAALARGGQRLPMAIHPSGTINLLAREGGFFRSETECARALLGRGPGRVHYPVAIAGTCFLACASIGPDSAAVAGLSPRLKRLMGRYAYLVALLGVAWRWRRPSLHLAVNAETHSCEAVYLAKGRYFAGPWSIAPLADSRDPRIHIRALKRARRRDFLSFAWDVWRGRDPGERDNVLSLTGTSITIAGTDAPPVQADGDIVAGLPVELVVEASPLELR